MQPRDYTVAQRLITWHPLTHRRNLNPYLVGCLQRNPTAINETAEQIEPADDQDKLASQCFAVSGKQLA